MGHTFLVYVAELSAALKNETSRKSIWPLMNVIMCALHIAAGLCGAARLMHYVYGCLLPNCVWIFLADWMNRTHKEFVCADR